MIGPETDSVDLTMYNREVSKLAAHIGRALRIHDRHPDRPLAQFDLASLDTYMIVELGIGPEDGEMVIKAMNDLTAIR